MTKQATNNIPVEDMQKIRQELEEQFFQLAQDELNTLKIRPRERNQLARKVVAAAEKDSGNKSREALYKAFYRQVQLERYSLGHLHQENVEMWKKQSAELQQTRKELEAECLRILKKQMDFLYMYTHEQENFAQRVVSKAKQTAAANTVEAFKTSFYRQVAAEQKALDRIMEQIGLSNFTTKKDKQLALAQLEEGDRLREASMYKEAAACYDRARKIYHQLGHPRGVAAALGGMSRISDKLGDLATSEKQMNLALITFKQFNIHKSAAIAFSHLGNLASKQGDMEKACEHWANALTRYTNAGMRESEQAQELIQLLNRHRY